MSSERDVVTKQAVSNEITALRVRCVEALNIIENSPLDIYTSTENVTTKSLAYVEGVRTVIQDSSTPIPTDKNLLTAQFLNEIKEKTIQVKEINAFLRGCASDVDSENNRLKNQIQIAEEVKSRACLQRTKVQPAHLKEAKETFLMFKTQLQGLLSSLFPDKMENMCYTLAELVELKASGDSTGYVPVTSENFTVMQLLMEKNVVVTNPYNIAEIRLAM